MHIDFEDMLKASVREVFSTMLNMKITFDTPGVNPKPEAFVAGSIGFTGKFNAIIYLCTTAVFARQMTGALLGLPDHQIEGQAMIHDALGELTNMHAGHLKSRMSDRGYPCVMTIPSIIAGSDFQIVAIAGAQRVTIWARSPNSDLVWLELLVKADT